MQYLSIFAGIPLDTIEDFTRLHRCQSINQASLIGKLLQGIHHLFADPLRPVQAIISAHGCLELGESPGGQSVRRSQIMWCLRQIVQSLYSPQFGEILHIPSL
jgi:hypothetical protein